MNKWRPEPSKWLITIISRVITALAGLIIAGLLLALLLQVIKLVAGLFNAL